MLGEVRKFLEILSWQLTHYKVVRRDTKKSRWPSPRLLQTQKQTLSCLPANALLIFPDLPDNGRIE